jgi:uncharacterized protein
LNVPAVQAISSLDQQASDQIAMTNEERDIIARFIARVGGAPAQSGFTGGSVPATATPPLPPIDREADAFIAEQFQRYPEARYRMTQTAFAQEAALGEAQNRIQRLEWELQQARQQAQQAQQQQQQSRGGGLFGGLFGGGQRTQQAPGGYQQAYQPPPPPPPVYAQGYAPSMMQRGGSGFLGSALTTAAGVAGGVLAADAISSLFSGSHGGGGGLFGGGAAPGSMSETVINNNYGTDAGQDPWSGAGAAPDTSFPDNGGDPWSGAGAPDNAPPADDFSGGGTDWGDQGGSSDDFI